MRTGFYLLSKFEDKMHGQKTGRVVNHLPSARLETTDEIFDHTREESS